MEFHTVTVPDLFGKIKTTRSARGLSLERLGSLTGLSAGYLGAVERGERRPSAASLASILRALGLGSEVRIRAEEPVADQRQDVRAARRLQARHFQWELDRLDVSLEVSATGDATISRRFLGCRPIRGRGGIRKLRVRERGAQNAAGSAATPGLMTWLAQPTGIDYSHRSWTEGPFRVHEISFDQLWIGESGDAFSFAIVNTLRHAFPSSPEELRRRIADARHVLGETAELGRFSDQLTLRADELHLSVTLPTHIRPVEWGVASWYSLGSMDEDSLQEIVECESHDFHHAGNFARVSVRTPLAGVSYALWWRPPKDWNVS